ncbi:MGF_360-6L [African swine fever virus]|nr:MGF_360-6L [African swine fever virus]WKW81328.1 MGF_360-6L [African swine fever virus]WKW81494.1 MGF_360-6L [African swine fever virus]
MITFTAFIHDNTMNSLQVLTKKVLIENKAFSNYHEDDIFILQQLGLWWENGPIGFCKQCKMVTSGSMSCSDVDSYELDRALVRAVKKNQTDLIKLFVLWGANINYGIICAKTERTKVLCIQLGADPKFLDVGLYNMFVDLIKQQKVLLAIDIYYDNISILDSFDSHDFYVLIDFIYNRFILNLDEKEKMIKNTYVLKFWFKIAIEFNLIKPIRFLSKKFPHLDYWRLKTAVYLGNVDEIHHAYFQENIRLDPNDMMSLACMYPQNKLGIYYCFALGANINTALETLIGFINHEVNREITFFSNYGIWSNVHFCISLGANPYTKKIQETLLRQEKNVMMKLLFKKGLLSPHSILHKKILEPSEVRKIISTYEYTETFHSFSSLRDNLR